jgi:hypothetical protein
MPDARDEGSMASGFRPFNRLALRLCGMEHMVSMIFDNKILNRAILRAPLGRAQYIR